jgi:hypothetical protein
MNCSCIRPGRTDTTRIRTRNVKVRKPYEQCTERFLDGGKSGGQTPSLDAAIVASGSQASLRPSLCARRFRPKRATASTGRETYPFPSQSFSLLAVELDKKREPKE